MLVSKKTKMAIIADKLIEKLGIEHTGSPVYKDVEVSGYSLIAYWDCAKVCPACVIEKAIPIIRAEAIEQIKAKREEIARNYMVQCEKGEPFECSYLETCEHPDCDNCQWQLDMADQIIALFEEGK